MHAKDPEVTEAGVVDADLDVADMLADHALQPVPREHRQSLIQLVVVQAGWNISVSSFLVGGIVGAGVPFWTGVLAILLGNAVLVCVSTLVGLVGCRTGLTSYLISRIVFGVRGSVLVSLMLGVIAMGFIGVLMDTWGQAVHQLIPEIPAWGFVLAFAIAITSTSIFGFKGLARYSAIAVPIEVAIALFALYKIGSLGDGFGEVIDHQPSLPIGFGVAVGAVIATWITGAALVSDVTRYAARPRDVLISNIAGFVIGAGVFETIAMVSAMKMDQSNFVLVMSGLGLLAPAAVMLFLALWNTADNNLYSASLAFTNASNILGVKVLKPVWTLVAIMLAVAIAFSGASTRFSGVPANYRRRRSAVRRRGDRPHDRDRTSSDRPPGPCDGSQRPVDRRTCLGGGCTGHPPVRVPPQRRHRRPPPGRDRLPDALPHSGEDVQR